MSFSQRLDLVDVAGRENFFACSAAATVSSAHIAAHHAKYSHVSLTRSIYSSHCILAGDKELRPLRFVLLRPLSAALSSPAALISAALPLLPRLERDDVVTLAPCVNVYRLIDPAHKEPFISLARILLACAITPIEALLRFPHVAKAYDTTLGGIAPFVDLWVPLQLARQVVLELGRLDELEALLDWDSRRAWTVEDREVEALLHNWRIPTECLSPADYSTKAMLATTFDRIVLLPPSSQVRTLLPPLDAIPSYGQSNGTESDPGSEYDQLWSKVVEWSVVEYERWNHRDHLGNVSNPATPLHGVSSEPVRGGSRLGLSEADRFDLDVDSDGDTDETSSDLTPLFLYTTLTHLLQLDALVPTISSDQPAPDTLAHLPSVPPLRRAALLHFSSPSLPPWSLDYSTSARLYLLDAITRLVAHQYRQRALESLAATRTRHQIREALLVAEQAKFGDLQTRLGQVEARLEEDENRKRERASRDRLMRERVKALEEEVDRLSLGARNARNTADVGGSVATHFQAGKIDTRSAVMTATAAATFVLGVAIGIALANAAAGGGPGRV